MLILKDQINSLQDAKDRMKCLPISVQIFIFGNLNKYFFYKAIIKMYGLRFVVAWVISTLTGGYITKGNDIFHIIEECKRAIKDSLSKLKRLTAIRATEDVGFDREVMR